MFFGNFYDSTASIEDSGVDFNLMNDQHTKKDLEAAWSQDGKGCGAAGGFVAMGYIPEFTQNSNGVSFDLFFFSSVPLVFQAFAMSPEGLDVVNFCVVFVFSLSSETLYHQCPWRLQCIVDPLSLFDIALFLSSCNLRRSHL